MNETPPPEPAPSPALPLPSPEPSPAPAAVPPAPAPPPEETLAQRQVCLRLAGIGVLFLILHAPAILINAKVAASNAEFSHVFIIPFISFYLAWQNRAQLVKTPLRTNWFGLLPLAWGIYEYLVLLDLGRATPLAFFMIGNLFSLTLFICGLRLTRQLLLPLAYLIFAVPTDLLLAPLTNRLQEIAAQGSEIMINLFGFPATVEAERMGSTLQIYHDGLLIVPPLNVAEACSGLRMLMAFAALGVAMAYLMRNRPTWCRVLLMVLTIPIAIFSNMLRVAGMGLAYPWFPQITSGDLHTALGLLMLVPAILLFNLAEWLLDVWLESRAQRAKH